MSRAPRTATVPAPMPKPFTPEAGKFCYYVGPETYVMDEGFRAAIVFENVPGYTLTGNWPYNGKPGQVAPYFWGHKLAEAQAQADRVNQDLGVSRKEAGRIIGSSMSAGPTARVLFVYGATFDVLAVLPEGAGVKASEEEASIGVELRTRYEDAWPTGVTPQPGEIWELAGEGAQLLDGALQFEGAVFRRPELAVTFALDTDQETRILAVGLTTPAPLVPVLLANWFSDPLADGIDQLSGGWTCKEPEAGEVWILRGQEPHMTDEGTRVGFADATIERVYPPGDPNPVRPEPEMPRG